MPATTPWKKPPPPTSALEIIDRMQTIIDNEMLVRGHYVTVVMNDDLRHKGSVCGGHRACAIGAAWLAAGVEPRVDEFARLALPGARENERAGFLLAHPLLKQAMDALRDAAETVAASHGYEIGGEYLDPLESLFEEGIAHVGDEVADTTIVTVMRDVCDKARARLATTAQNR